MNQSDMNFVSGQRAVIYARVSSTAQTKRGDGLSSQETRCRELARSRGYEIVATFSDDTSGSAISRPGMKALLAFLKKHRKHAHVVLIDDISRLARGVKAHIELRAAISLAGGILESPSVEFGDDADSELQEFILATVAQHQRRKNAEQTTNRIRARVMNGYWPFQRPLGYRHESKPGHGKVLARSEPIASIIQEALEGYASGRFQLQSEVKYFLESFPEYPRTYKGEVTNEHVFQLLRRPIYAGYVEAPSWGVSLRQGQHEGLISFETFQKIQKRLSEGAKVPARKNIGEDFALRGFVVCGACETPMTACWAKGRNGRYAYYHCRRKGCEAYGKSVRREELEAEFETLLKSLVPTEGLFRAARAMLEDLWKHRLNQGELRARTLKTELQKTDRQIEQLLDRITETESPSVIGAYEKRIRKLESDKLELAEKIAASGKPLRSFDETVRTALDFLANPWKIWASERLDYKRAVLKLAFSDRLQYVRGEGFRTANLALPFKALAGIFGSEMGVAHPTGFEPVAFAFGVQSFCTMRDKLKHRKP